MTSDDAAREKRMRDDNEELRQRNLALLAKNAQMEEQLWRLRHAPGPLLPPEQQQNVEGVTPMRAAPPELPPHSSAEVAFSAAVTSSLWQFLDSALQGAVRARAEARRAHAECLLSLDSTFGPLDKAARLKARALLAQSSRGSAKLQAALQQLESESSAALIAHDSDMAQWAERIRFLQARFVAQEAATSRTLSLELKKAEAEHAAHAAKLRQDIDRLEAARAHERGLAKAEVARLSSDLSELDSRASSSSSQWKKVQQKLTADSSQLRERLAKVEAELQEEKSARATESIVSKELVESLKEANSALRDELARASAETERMRAELGASVERLQGEKAGIVTELRLQMAGMAQEREAQVKRLEREVERLHVEKQMVTEQLSEQLRGLQADREADANHLHAKIARLKSVQTAALAAGSARGRQLLYTESLKSPHLMRASSMSWRGDDLRFTPKCGSPTSPTSPGRRTSSASLANPVSHRQHPSAQQQHFAHSTGASGRSSPHACNAVSVPPASLASSRSASARRSPHHESPHTCVHFESTPADTAAQAPDPQPAATRDAAGPHIFIGPRDIGPADIPHQYLGPPPYPDHTAAADSSKPREPRASPADNFYPDEDGSHAAVQEAVRQYLGGRHQPSSALDGRAAARLVGPYEVAYGGSAHRTEQE